MPGGSDVRDPIRVTIIPAQAGIYVADPRISPVIRAPFEPPSSPGRRLSRSPVIPRKR